MRRAYLPPLVSILLLLSTFSYGQAWSGIIAPTRAIDWSHAGLPASYPNGDTTPNGWTPPDGSWTQCGSTLAPSGGDDTSQINSALAACPANHYVLLGTGTFSIQNQISLVNSYVVLRGSGPMKTTLQASGSGWMTLGQGWGGGYGTATAGLSAGSTSITISSSSTPVASNMAWLTQCDTGTSGNPCSGTPVDNGGIFVCGLNNVCQSGNTSGPPPPIHEKQVFFINSVVNNGGGSYTVNVSNPIYGPTWSTAQTAVLTWYQQSLLVMGSGFEDFTVIKLPSDGQNNVMYLNQSYGSWVTGVRLIGIGEIVSVANNKQSLFAGNYVFGYYPSAPPPGDNVVTQLGQGSDDLFMNNIIQGGVALEGSGENQGEIIAYNYARDGKMDGVWVSEYQHASTPFFTLHEGEEVPQAEDDDTWGTNALTTYFRNYYRGTDNPYVTTNPSSAFAITIANYARFTNVVGNVLGTPGVTTVYDGGPAEIYSFESGDPLNQPSTMRWGNFDVVTNGVRWCGNSSSPGWPSTCSSTSEIPTSLSGNAAPLENFVPSGTALPASLFLGVTAHPSGGTGLNWWKVCKTWTTFPTSCATTQTNPFPPIGPDVTGGPYDGGYAYDNPAQLAYKSLPIDASYQSSYTVTGSSWSSGTETLTISGIPSNTNHITGGFQLSGANSACEPTGGVSYTGSYRSDGEILMTGSTTTSVSYALSSNPGASCTGTMKFPDVRQFDERVYQSDTGSNPLAPNAPTGLSAVVQ